MKEVLNSVLDYLIDTRKLHQLREEQNTAYHAKDITKELGLRLEEEALFGKLLLLEGLQGLKDTLNKE